MPESRLMLFVLFCVVAAMVLRAMLRPVGKLAWIALLLAVLGVLPIPVLQHLIVGFVVFLFTTMKQAMVAVVGIA